MSNLKGFSLVEVMIALGIGAVVTLGIASTLEMMNKAQRTNDQNIEANFLAENISRLLAEPSTCQLNWGSTSIGGAVTMSPTTVFTRDIVDDGGNTVFDVNNLTATFGNNKIRLQDYKLVQIAVVSTSPYVVLGELKLNIQQVGVGFGGSAIPKSVYLNVELTGAGGTMTTCNSLGVSANLVTTPACPPNTYLTQISGGTPNCQPANNPSAGQSCTAGQIITGFTAGGLPICASAPTNSVSCTLNSVVIGFDSAGVPLCAIPPSTRNVSCATGQVLKGFDSSGGPLCVTSGGGSPPNANFSCPPTQVISGFDSAGTPICASGPGTIAIVSNEINSSAAQTVDVFCPPGTVRVGCMGSREKDFIDTCSEDNCGIVGLGPIPGEGCRVQIDADSGGSGTKPKVWASCQTL